jgi:hypothetical protein
MSVKLLNPDLKISDLTVAQFADLLEFKGDLNRARMLEAERARSEALFNDIEGLRAVTTPFRMKSAADVDKMTSTLKQAFIDNGGIEIIAIIAMTGK